MKCHNYFNYWDDDDQAKTIVCGFGFYIYESVSEQHRSDSKECVIVYNTYNKIVCIIPIIQNEILFGESFNELSGRKSREIELPDAFKKAICKTYKNRIFF